MLGYAALTSTYNFTQKETTMKRVFQKAAAYTLIAIAGLAAFIAFKPRDVPVPSNSLTIEQQRELSNKANAGDAAAKYALTLQTENPEDAKRLLKESADAGYGPAVMTYVDSALQDKPEQAVQMLEASANRGYQPAMIELVNCVVRAACGTNHNAAALKWAITYRLLLKESGQKESALIEGAENRLAKKVLPAEKRRIQYQAEQLAKNIPADKTQSARDQSLKPFPAYR